MHRNKQKSKKNILLMVAAFIILGAAFISAALLMRKQVTANKSYNRAIYIYMCGSTLEAGSGAASDNIRELLEAEIPSDTCIIIETGGSKRWWSYGIPNDKIARYQVKNHKLVLLEVCEDANMGEADTLKSFLNFCADKYSVQQAGVVFWDHGDGCHNSVCFDAKHDFDGLTIGEMEAAFREVLLENQKYEFIGFDACLMSTYDILSMTSRYANHLIASEETEANKGWDYKALGEAFGQDDFYGKILESYEALYRESEKKTYTLSHADLSKFAIIQDEFPRFLEYLTFLSEKDLRGVLNSAKKSISFGGNANAIEHSDLIDLGDFALYLGYERMADLIKDCIQTVQGKAKEGAMGVSIFFPVYNQKKLSGYHDYLYDSNYYAFLQKCFVNEGNLPEVEMDEVFAVDGEVLAHFAKEAADSLWEVTYSLQVVYEEVDSPFEDNVERISLGLDQAKKINETTYKTDFKGEWLIWNDVVLYTELMDENEGSLTYMTPVKRNGVSGSAIIIYDEAISRMFLEGFIPYDDLGLERIEYFEEGDQISLISQSDYEKEWKTFLYSEQIQPAWQTVSDGWYIMNIIATNYQLESSQTKYIAFYYQDGQCMLVVE